MTAVVPRLHVLEVVDVVYFVDVGVDDSQPVAVVVTKDHVVEHVMVEVHSEGWNMSSKIVVHTCTYICC